MVAETPVSSLKGLGGLTKLELLDLNDTQVDSLEELRGLVNLQELDLNNTRVSSLEPLSSLPKLDHLSISWLSLDRIPKWLVDKRLPYHHAPEGSSRGVYMHEVQLLEQPDVFLYATDKERETYYQSERLSVNEAKVIFLGESGVGKTYTLYRIEHNGETPQDIGTTQGVEISQYRREGKPTINFWDFGGSEVLRSTYRYFLTERSCYVVTVSPRCSDVMEQARRRVKGVEAIAPCSKVILAVNRWEGVFAGDLDKERLKAEFPNLVEIVEYTATETVEELKRVIDKDVDSIYSVAMTLPKSWLAFMEKFRNFLEGSQNHITYRAYLNLCKDSEIESEYVAELLLSLFVDIGVCYAGDLEYWPICNVKWLTNAFCILTNNWEYLNSLEHITCEEVKSFKSFRKMR